MLPQLSLDDERFFALAERARETMREYYPLWTDHNSHDPGITILELFAWLLEMQQFHLDQIGEEHLRRFLALLGTEPAPGQCARAVLELAASEPVTLAKGSRFFAGHICFELEEEASVCGAGILSLVSRPAGEGRRRVFCGDGLSFPVFGEPAEAGSALYLGLSAPIPANTPCRLYVELAAPECGVRNPIGKDDAFEPLVELALSYQTHSGFLPCALWEDTTHGLLNNGFLVFSAGEDMEESDGLYWLRLALAGGGYDAPPVLTGLWLNAAPAVQKRTLAECHDGRTATGEICVSTHLALTGEYLLFERREEGFFPYRGRVERKTEGGSAHFFLPEETGAFAYRLLCCESRDALFVARGSGLPFQEYESGFSDLCADGLLLMAEAEENSGCFLPFERRSDFAEAKEEDPVFVFCGDTGKLRFGDGERGLVPEGEILLAAACQSLGERGNVRAQAICVSEEAVTVTNRRDASGGRAAETLSECKKRLSQRMSTAVTESDFEELVRQTPGLMIESVRVLPAAKRERQDGSLPEETVAIVVKPASQKKRPALSAAYRRNILRALEPHRLLGTRIEVLSPEYVGISVYARIRTRGEGRRRRSALEAVVAAYFQEIKGSFGQRVSVSGLYGRLDIQAEAASVISIHLDAQGSGVRRGKSGDVLLPANGLAYLKECILELSEER